MVGSAVTAAETTPLQINSYAAYTGKAIDLSKIRVHEDINTTSNGTGSNGTINKTAANSTLQPGFFTCLLVTIYHFF